MIYKAKVDAIEKLLDNEEIKCSEKVISLAEFQDIIIQDINEYQLHSKYNALKNKFNEQKYKDSIFGTKIKIRNPIINSSSYSYSDELLEMRSFLSSCKELHINADKNGIENFVCDSNEKDKNYIKEFIVDNKDEFNEFLFGIMEYTDSFNANLCSSYLHGKDKKANFLNFSGHIPENNWLSYEFKMNHFMLNPEVSINHVVTDKNIVFIDDVFDPKLMVQNNEEAIKKRVPIQIESLDTAFVKKIKKYR